jgi:hypothetical protein
MATAADIRAVLDVLCRYYRDKDNLPRRLDEVQIVVYLDGLEEFSADALEFAARRWMRESKWFPALSDLRGLLFGPAIDWSTAALIAWTTFERAIGLAGIYRGVTFSDAAIGETVRQTFGSWEHACNYDRDSPGWTIRRQTFLGLFPHVAQRLTDSAPVTLRGLGQVDKPLLIKPVDGIPKLAPALAAEDRSVNVLAEVTRRFKQRLLGQPGES